MTGKSYEFTLAFTDTSVNTLTQPSTPKVNILVKCTKSVECSGLSSNSLTYFITETTSVNITCIKTPSICPSTTVLQLTSTGTTAPPVEFYAFSRDADNKFTVTFNSSNPQLTG